MALKTVGQGNEYVTTVMRVQGDKSKLPISSRSANMPKEAAYKIVKEGGEVVASGQFEYG